MTPGRTAFHATPTRRLRRVRLRPVTALVAVAIGALFTARPVLSQDLGRFDRDNARMMLKITREDLVKYYYDPTYHGVRLDEVFGAADAAIDRATSHAELFRAIAEPLKALHDSHTFFIPPAWAGKLEFGWIVRMIGDRCYLVAVQPGSDAEAQGLKRGDEVLSIDGTAPTRGNMSDLLIETRLLAPRASSLLVVRSPGGQPREVIARTKVTPDKRRWTSATDLSRFIREIKDQGYLGRHRLHQFGTDLLIWKMPEFDLTGEEVARNLRQVGKSRALILDLRGNPGGAVETLEYMVGGFLGEKVTIGDARGREEENLHPSVSRKAASVYEGTVVILIDSDSGSAAEVFARTMQLNHRAKVLGDRSGGSVMMSRFYPRKVGMGTVMYFGSSVTIADIIMTDGKSLEGTGVTPDEIVLPTADDIAAGRDPALARAASLCGKELGPDKAGALFPFEWKR